MKLAKSSVNLYCRGTSLSKLKNVGTILKLSVAMLDFFDVIGKIYNVWLYAAIHSNILKS